MKAVLEGLLKSENEAKEIVRKAEAEGRHRVANARAEAQQRSEAIRSKAAAETQRVIDEELQKAHETKARRLSEARTANRAEAHIPDDLAQRAIESICRAVMGTHDAAQR